MDPVEENNIDYIKSHLNRPDTVTNLIIRNHWLLAAVKSRNINMVNLLLLEYQQDPNAYSKCLCYAAGNGYDDIIKIFLNHGANVNHPLPDTGLTPLIAAASAGEVAVVKILLNENNSDPNGGEYGDSALMLAVENAHVECVEELLKAGADPNFINFYQDASCHYAVYSLAKRIDSYKDCDTMCKKHSDFKTIIKLLLTYGADTTIINRDGYTARDIAEKKCDQETINIISGCGKLTKRARQIDNVDCLNYYFERK